MENPGVEELDMLTVTEVATARLAQMLKQQSMPERIAVCCVCEGQSIAL